MWGNAHKLISIDAKNYIASLIIPNLFLLIPPPPMLLLCFMLPPPPNPHPL